jgi:hypothetical protein
MGLFRESPLKIFQLKAIPVILPKLADREKVSYHFALGNLYFFSKIDDV